MLNERILYAVGFWYGGLVLASKMALKGHNQLTPTGQLLNLLEAISHIPQPGTSWGL